TILSALSRLTAGGTTAGGAGIQLAYNEARKHFIKGGNNRVILATDGDFNVGVSSTAGLVKLIEKERASGVFLSVLGFGRGNYQDARMEELSNHGNGVAAYIDSLAEARKVLVNEAGSTLVTVAKDVKLQVEFNPLKVSQYRLIGYSNRMLNHEDFRDDKKDAGDMGAGHTVTALYEIVPNVEGSTGLDSGTFRYQKRSTETSRQNELLSFKVRFKKPDSAKSELRERVLIDHATPLAKTSNSFRFAAAVAQFGMILSKSNHVGNSNFNDVLALAEKALGRDKHQYRKGFVSLVRKALSLQSRQPARL
ncbi:MAG: vWA domain-containing protein, partial [Bradymonadia bacterium]